MRRWWFLPVVLALLLLPPVGGSGALRADDHEKHDFSDVELWKERFEDPERYKWQKPREIVAFLGLRVGQRVADLRTGTGYLLPTLSLHVGRQGKVYAVDIEPAMLDYLTSRDDIMQERVFPILAKASDPKLPEGEVDLVLTVNTWHHIKKRTRYLRRLEKGLTPEGRIAVIDFRAGELPVGPPPGKKVPRDEVIAEFEEAGWRYVAESVALPYQYLLIFLPPEDPNRRVFGS